MPDANPWFGQRQLSLYALCIKAFTIRMLLFKEAIDRHKEIGENTVKDRWSFYRQILQADTEEELSMYISELQQTSDRLRFECGREYGDEVIDYAIPANLSEKNLEEKCFSNSVFYGERWLMYKMFSIIYSKEEKRYHTLTDLFFAYLIIKERVRKELIQMNEYFGFKNFQEYQNRKEIFIKRGSVYDRLIVNLAVNGTMSNPNIRYLEARISPTNNALDLLKTIETYDKYVDEECFNSFKVPQPCIICPLNQCYTARNTCSIYQEMKEELNYYYVLYFLKKSEKIKDGQYSLADYIRPRNGKLRKLVKEQTMAINIARRFSTETKKTHCRSRCRKFRDRMPSRSLRTGIPIP